jgi:hypothetical protein
MGWLYLPECDEIFVQEDVGGVTCSQISQNLHSHIYVHHIILNILHHFYLELRYHITSILIFSYLILSYLILSYLITGTNICEGGCG